MRVPADYVCEHGYPHPWSTCMDCMLKPGDQRPEPPPPAPPPRPARRGSLPQHADDPIPDLIGDKDMSYPVWDIDAHTTGPGNDWLFADNGFPWELRRGGWIYLRCDGRLGARARVTGIGFRQERRQHTGPPDDIGPGPTIKVDPDTWEPIDIDLGDLAHRQRQGYRYLITRTDGSIEHLMAGEPPPGETDVDPPAG